MNDIARAVDDSAISERADQPSLPGVQWDMEGEYRLGGGRRVAKERALIEHMDEVLANDSNNLAAVLRANARKHEEAARLRPYWVRGMTKREAVTAYLAEHPDSEDDVA